MLWIKAFHIVFVVAWFSGLFYLPRILVNLALENEAAARARLLIMARKLYRFMTLLAMPALAFGFWLWLGYGVSGGWLHAKLALVLVAIGYHHQCRSLLRSFEKLENRRRERWFRVFNEMAVLLFAAIVILVVVRPF